MRRQPVDRDPALQDQLFHFAARAQAAFGQHLVQLRGIVLCRQLAHRLRLGARDDRVFLVVLFGNHEAEQVLAAGRGLVGTALALALALRLGTLLAAALRRPAGSALPLGRRG
ncbi:hypothetical protein D9M72_505920 [compost metagenome]